MKSEPVTVPLSDPIEAHGETQAALTIRGPTGADIKACGYPLIAGIDETVTFDGGAMSKMIGRLAGIPPSSADKLSARDWQRCAAAIAVFFGDGPEGS